MSVRMRPRALSERGLGAPTVSGDKPAKTTALPYRDVLERLWIGSSRS